MSGTPTKESVLGKFQTRGDADLLQQVDSKGAALGWIDASGNLQGTFLTSAGDVSSVNGHTGAVVLAATDVGAVATTGNETVAGVKTFSSSPIVPTPSGATDAASKGYIDTNGVFLTGDQAVAGVKTFASSPIVPAPTTALQASTKQYVDDHGLTFVKITLNTAAVLALPTAFQIVAAPSAGLATVVTSCRIEYIAGATPFTIANADNKLALIYATLTTTPIAETVATGLADNAANRFGQSAFSATAIATPAAKAVQLILTGTTPALTLGNGSLVVFVSYYTITL